MMKFENYKQCICIIALVSVSMGSCSSSTDPYQPFVGEKEIEYSQKPDKVIALSGQSRVVLKLVRPASPRVKKAGIFWNTGTDSLIVDFPTDKDTLQVSVSGLEGEGRYSFDIYTYDKNGDHRSVVTTKSVNVYGDVYANSIKNRLLAYLSIQDLNTGNMNTGNMIVHWEPNPEGSIGTVLKYTNTAGESDSTLVPPDFSKISIPLSGDAEALSYYSLYRPGASIDTFRTSPPNEFSISNTIRVELKNPGFPVEHGDWDGRRWGVPKDWEVNNAVKTQGGYGGFDKFAGVGYFSMERWSANQPQIINGKIYQSITLPAGSYIFEADFSTFSIEDEAYIVVAEGGTLPDVGNVSSSSLGYAIFDDPVVEFTLLQKTEISVGFIATFQQDKQTFRCKGVRLYSKRE